MSERSLQPAGLGSVRIRAAVWGDAGAIARLVEAMGGHDGVTTARRWPSALAAAIQATDARVLVAERDGRVVGVAHLDVRPSLVHGGREAWLGVLAVDPGERHTGIGHELLDAVERAAALLGCSAVALESSHWRTDAHAFYRESGFREQTPARRFARVVGPLGSDLIDRFLSVAAQVASAVAAALAAGGEDDVATGADGLPTKAVDRAAETIAVALLRELGVPILSEETGMVDGRTPRDGEPWIALDPLDGTRNFTRGHPPWGIAMGLVAGGAPLAGYVADLSSGRRWWGVPGEGAWVDGRRATPRRGGLLVVPGLTADGTAPTLPDGFDRVRMAGATTVELCRVADGGAGAFADLDRGVVRVHDLAGPMAVLLGAGCCVFALDGTVPVLEPDPTRRHRIVAAASLDDVGALTTWPGAVVRSA